jgi:hypothetical protein
MALPRTASATGTILPECLIAARTLEKWTVEV